MLPLVLLTVISSFWTCVLIVAIASLLSPDRSLSNLGLNTRHVLGPYHNDTKSDTHVIVVYNKHLPTHKP